MNKAYISLLLVLSLSFLMGTTIYEIQYTEIPGDGSYPSPLEGETVNVTGIVNAVDFAEGRFFITSEENGPWKGLYVYSNDYDLQLGDEILVNADVYEYNGLTELNPIYDLEILSQENSVPAPITVSTEQIDIQEDYESVYVKVEDVEITNSFDTYNNWKISDGSGSCFVSNYFFDQEDITNLLPLVEGYNFAEVTGVVYYDYDEYRLNPRSISDLVSAEDGVIVSTRKQVVPTTEIQIPIYLSYFGSPKNVSQYEFSFQYDNSVLDFSGFNLDNTISQNGETQVEDNNNGLTSVTFDGDVDFIGTEPLIILSYTVMENGTFLPYFPEFTINDTEIEWFRPETVTVSSSYEPVADTLTIIQKPIHNIPEIVTPFSEMTILCNADQSVNYWEVSLVYEELEIPLSVASSQFSEEYQQWTLTVEIPEIELSELYDLKVIADSEVDISQNTVKYISEYKDNYSFVHITDTHLPTHYYYDEEESLTDTSEVTDFLEVIKDINLINPEFVILTGDIVNEGELEDFQNRRYFSKAKRLLEKIEVPVFLVSGNHDLGGWDDTPPPQGTARRNWWNFFGWKYLENPPDAYELYTQNYTFNYSSTKFIGLESYDNYDGFMQDVYGWESFTNPQLEWLGLELESTPVDYQIVTFYHYDFSEQINLNNMGIDMSLWGHIHSNEGDIYQHPYSLATDAICDETRAYRIIKVDQQGLTPKETVYSSWPNDNLSVDYLPSNNGLSDSVTAILNNQHNLNFADIMLKFHMPADEENYLVENGTVFQVANFDDETVVYVETDISQYSEKEITCAVTTSSDQNFDNTPVNSLRTYPNPFNLNTQLSKNFSSMNIEFTLNKTAKVKLDIINLKGQKVKTITNKEYTDGRHFLNWDCRNKNNKISASGIYFLRLIINKNEEKIHKFLLLK